MFLTSGMQHFVRSATIVNLDIMNDDSKWE